MTGSVLDHFNMRVYQQHDPGTPPTGRVGKSTPFIPWQGHHDGLDIFILEMLKAI